MNETQQILRALIITYTAIDKKQRDDAESYLARLQSQPGFFEHMCDILETDLQFLTSDIRNCRKALLNYLNKYTTKMFVVSGGGISTQLKNSVLERLLACLTCRTLPHEDKLEIVSILAVVLIQDKSIHQYPERLVKHAQEALKHRHMLLGCYLLFAILLSTKQLNITVAIYKVCMDKLLEQLYNKMETLGPMLDSFLMKGDPLVELEQTMATCELAWKVAFNQIRLLEFDKFRATVIHLVKNIKVFNTIMFALRLAPESCKSQMIIVHSDRRVLRLNRFRQCAMESLYCMLKGIKEAKFKLSDLQHVIQIYEELLCGLVMRLPQEISLRRTILNEHDEHQFDYPDRLLELYLLVSAVATRHTQHYQFIIQHRQGLINNMILAMYTPDLRLRRLMSSQPMDYVRTLIDMCDRQTISSARAGAGKLLEAMCDKVDGTVSYISEIAFELVRCGLANINQQLVTTETTLSQNVKNSQFFSTTTWEYKLQAGLLILAELSYIIDMRPDLLLCIEKLLDESIDRLTECQSPFVMVAFVLFYEYYSDSLYVKGEGVHPTLQKMVVYLIRLSKSPEPPISGIRHQMYSTLTQILCQPNLSEKFGEHIYPIIVELLPNILMSESHQLLTLINQLLLTYSKHIVTDRAKLLNVLQTVAQGIQSEQQPTTNYNILLESYLQMLMSLTACKEYYPYLDEICMALSPCMSLLRQKSSFHDSIISVVNTCMKSTKQTRPQLQLILKSAQKMIQWNDQSLRRLFETLNLACIYTESTDVQTVGRLFELSLHCMSHLTEQTIPNDLVQGCLIMQILLYYHHQILPDTLKHRLLTTTLHLIDTQHAVLEQQIYAKYLLLLLQLINFDYQFSSQSLQRMNKVEDTLSLLYNSAVPYADNYDSKVFAINQIQIFQRRWTQFNITILNKMFRQLVTVLKRLYEQANGQRSQTDLSMQRYNDAEDSDDDDETSREGQTCAEDLCETYKATMKVLVSPYKQMDEFAFFNKLLNKLREQQRSHEILREVVQGLPEALRNFLMKTAVCVQKVFSEGNMQPRRIVKVKRTTV